MRRYCPARAEEEDVQGDGNEPEDVLEEEEPEDLDEIMGEVNEWDQTLYGAGRGGATEEEEQQALQLQQHVARQRHQRERTPPARGESEASSAVDMEDLQLRWQALQRSPPSQRRRLASPPQEEDGDHGRPVFPEPPQPLPLPSPSGIDLGIFIQQ